MHRCASKTLYLGLDPHDIDCVHYPVIRIDPRPKEDPEIRKAFADLAEYSHLIFTSRQTVIHFFQQQFDRQLLNAKVLFAIGEKTRELLQAEQVQVVHCPEEETQEGLIALLQNTPISRKAHFFYPRSSLARPLLGSFLQKWQVRILDLYYTRYQKLEPIPDLALFDRIIFTSPSTVRGFLQIFTKLPTDKELIAIGPITAEELRKNQLLHS